MEIIGTGFIARSLRPLADDHDDVLVLAAGVSHPENSEPEYQRETATVQRAVEQCLEQRRKLVFFSTAGIYGGDGCRGVEDEPASPPTRYGRHKLGLETLIRESGVGHLSLRLGYVLGREAPPHRLIPSLIRQIDSGRVSIYRGAYRDLIDIDDMVAITRSLLAARVRDEVINVASGVCVPIDRIVDHLEDRLGARAERHYIERDSVHCLSAAKLRRLAPEAANLGFGPDYFRSVVDRYLVESGRLAAPGTTHPR